ncbi:hypothetical protein HDU76_013099 [Blyttiomyces sp. JEL0837]|nr:hypothetical protein HDU76_013099 [Blyttiomyces sp. JEL0837]
MDMDVVSVSMSQGGQSSLHQSFMRNDELDLEAMEKEKDVSHVTNGRSVYPAVSIGGNGDHGVVLAPTLEESHMQPTSAMHNHPNAGDLQLSMEFPSGVLIKNKTRSNNSVRQGNDLSVPMGHTNLNESMLSVGASLRSGGSVVSVATAVEPKQEAVIEIMRKIDEYESLPMLNFLPWVCFDEPEHLRILPLDKKNNLIKTMALRIIDKVTNNAQWIDTLSMEVITSLIKRIPKAGILLFTRPLTEDLLLHSFVKGKVADITHIILNGLNEEEIEQHLAVDDNNKLIISTRNFDLDTLLVEDMQSAVITRFDRLNPDFQKVLRTASVMGQYFDLVDLVQVLGDTDMTVERLEHLIQLYDNQGFLACGSADSDEVSLYQGGDGQNTIYGFRNVIVMTSIVQSMPLSQKQSIHQKIGEHLESTLTEENMTYLLSTITFHFKNANNIIKSIEYLEMLASFQIERSMHLEAVKTIQQLISLTESITDRDLHEKHGPNNITHIVSLDLRKAWWYSILGEAQKNIHQEVEAMKNLKKALDYLSIGWPRGDFEVLVNIFIEGCKFMRYERLWRVGKLPPVPGRHNGRIQTNGIDPSVNKTGSLWDRLKLRTGKTAIGGSTPSPNRVASLKRKATTSSSRKANEHGEKRLLEARILQVLSDAMLWVGRPSECVLALLKRTNSSCYTRSLSDAIQGMMAMSSWARQNGHLKVSRIYFNKSLQIYNNHSDTKDIAIMKLASAHLYHSGDIEATMDCCIRTMQEALSLYKYSTIPIAGVLGATLIQLGRFSESRNVFQQELTGILSSEDPLRISMLLIHTIQTTILIGDNPTDLTGRDKWYNMAKGYSESILKRDFVDNISNNSSDKAIIKKISTLRNGPRQKNSLSGNRIMENPTFNVPTISNQRVLVKLVSLGHCDDLNNGKVLDIGEVEVKVKSKLSDVFSKNKRAGSQSKVWGQYREEVRKLVNVLKVQHLAEVFGIR